MTHSRRKRPAKLAHVAVAAGVSLGTASEALRGTGRMSDETRRRVVAAADALDYRPNANARLLAVGQSRIVALVAHGPNGGTVPRIYWPRLQAAFTEQLLAQGMVACTMTLNDLHQLDGLPFDLIVFAGLDATDSLPEQIRADYRVLDVGLSGDSPVAHGLRRQFAAACQDALTHLRAAGAQRPALVYGSAVGATVMEVYEQWCAANSTQPLVIRTDATDPMTPDHALAEGADGLLCVLADPTWVGHALTVAKTLPVVTMGTDPDPSGPGVRALVPDGEDFGAQLAAAAVAALSGSQDPELALRFRLAEPPHVTP